MMLSNAIRLAQAKGLHLGTPVNWNLTSEETASRHWLWWTLYSYDKHLTYRCGRPSVSAFQPRSLFRILTRLELKAIDDDYISCPIPAMPSHNAEMIDLFRIKTAEHAQISSAISKKLTSARTIHDPPEKLMATVRGLENRLETWRQSLPPAYWARPPFKNFSVTPGHELVHTLYLQFSYHVSTIATHAYSATPGTEPTFMAVPTRRYGRRYRRVRRRWLRRHARSFWGLNGLRSQLRFRSGRASSWTDNIIAGY